MRQQHHRPARRRNDSYTLPVALMVIFTVIIIVIVLLFLKYSLDKRDAEGTDTTVTTAPVTDVADTTDGTEADTSDTTAGTSDGTTVGTEAPVVTDPPVTDPPVTDPPVVTNPPATDPPVTNPPVITPPDIDYIPSGDRNTDFSRTLFIGNSITQGFMLYSDAVGATYFAERGLTVYSYFSTPVVDVNGTFVSTAQAVEMAEGFDTVFIMFGINELGWQNETSFYQSYTEVVNHVKANMPEAKIYLQSTIPVTSSRSATDQYFNNPGVHRYNEITLQIANELGVSYVDLVPALCGEGYDALPEEASFDGIHLQKPYCQRWLDRLNEVR